MKTTRKLLEGPGTRSVEDVHHLRLMALLKDMVRELGPVEAAEALGIDRKTVWRGLSAGRLSPRLVDALERLLLEEGVADSARQLERVEALERWVEEMAGDVEALREEMREGIEAVRGEIESLGGTGPSRSCEARKQVVRIGQAEAEGGGCRRPCGWGERATREADGRTDAGPCGRYERSRSRRRGGVRPSVAPGGRVAGIGAAARGWHEARPRKDEGTDHGVGDCNDRRARPDAAASELTDAPVGEESPSGLADEDSGRPAKGARKAGGAGPRAACADLRTVEGIAVSSSMAVALRSGGKRQGNRDGARTRNSSRKASTAV